MPDMIPAQRLVSMAKKRIAEARTRLADVEAYSSGAKDLKDARAAIDVALELLDATAPDDDRITVSADPAVRMVPVHLPELAQPGEEPPEVDF